jgi:hypothetical protein
MSAPADQLGSWLSGDLVERAVLAPLADHVLDRCTHVAENLQDPTPIGTRADLFERSRRWRYDVIELMSGASPEDPDCYINSRFDVDGAHLFVGLGGAVLAELEPRLIELASSWVLAWSRTASPVLQLAYGALAPRGADYPRRIPARESALYDFGSIVQFVGVSWHRARPDRNAVFTAMMAAPLPPGASRYVEGDVLVVRVLDALSDPSRIRQARAAHEAWLSPLCETAPQRGWNERGDRIVIPGEPEPRAPLTLYDPEPQIGYKAIVVRLDGTVDEALWTELVAIARAGALPDGTPLTGLRLIVPTREDALSIHDRALADGFQMVTYPEDRVFWEVKPT